MSIEMYYCKKQKDSIKSNLIMVFKNIKLQNHNIPL